MDKKDWLHIFFSVFFISIFAQLRIDLPFHDLNIPVTGQTFAVLVAAIFIGPKNAGLSILLYWILGIVGLPVFAKGASGIEVFQKGTGGYLYGFLIAAILTGWLGQKKWGNQLSKALLAMTIGTAIIIICGLLQLTYLYNWNKALEYGFYPFIWGAVIKIIIGGIFVYGINHSELLS